MKKKCINISIIGLGLTTIEELKTIFKRNTKQELDIHWTNIKDEAVDCLLINDLFFENENIQSIIKNKKLLYLKICKHIDSSIQDPEKYLKLPVTDENFIRDFLHRNFISELIESDINKPNNIDHIEIDFFQDIFKHNSRKLHVFDKNGTLAVIDHQAHFAWLTSSLKTYKSDFSLNYTKAETTDYIKVSHKQQTNLENWLFSLIWHSSLVTTLPNPNLYYRIRYWPQSTLDSKKVVLKLSAAFILGAELNDVSRKLNIPLATVQNFVAANQAINNIEIISKHNSTFGVSKLNDESKVEISSIRNFFGKIKRRFGF